MLWNGNNIALEKSVTPPHKYWLVINDYYIRIKKRDYQYLWMIFGFWKEDK